MHLRGSSAKWEAPSRVSSYLPALSLKWGLGWAVIVAAYCIQMKSARMILFILGYLEQSMDHIYGTTYTIFREYIPYMWDCLRLFMKLGLLYKKLKIMTKHLIYSATT